MGNLPSGQLAAARFKNSARGDVDADDRIIYNSATGQLFFDSNGSTPGGGIIIAPCQPICPWSQP